MKKILLLLALMFIFQSCRQTKDCPVLDAKYMALVNYAQDSIIRFVNVAGTEIDFRVTNTVASSPYTTDCFRGEIGYDCDRTPCSASASFNSISDSSRGGYNMFNMNFQSKIPGSTPGTMHISLFDYNRDVLFIPELSKPYGIDTLYTKLPLGTHIYDSVVTASIDTASQKDIMIWRVYLTSSSGIVAFADKQTNSIFYLK